MRTRTSLCLSMVVVWALVGSGCSLRSMREENNRLRESNERLISENNHLESELGRTQQESLAFAASAPQPLPAAPVDISRNPGNDRLAIAQDLLLGDDVQVTEVSQGVRIRIPDRVFFAPGRVQISGRGKTILNKIAGLVNSEYTGRTIRVDGHTDDTPIRKVRNIYPTNWELSTARACTVVRYLVEKGNVNAGRIYPAGFSYYRPVRSAVTRRENRRVEITILNDDENA